jgi:hypothetical protein
MDTSETACFPDLLDGALGRYWHGLADGVPGPDEFLQQPDPPPDSRLLVVGNAASGSESAALCRVESTSSRTAKTAAHAKTAAQRVTVSALKRRPYGLPSLREFPGHQRTGPSSPIISRRMILIGTKPPASRRSWKSVRENLSPIFAR